MDFMVVAASRMHRRLGQLMRDRSPPNEVGEQDNEGKYWPH